jgi:hypothetical protein
MKSICFLLIIICLNGYSQSSNDSISAVRTDRRFYQGVKNTSFYQLSWIESFNLRDSVKSITTYFPTVNDTEIIRKTQINQKYYPYTEFNKNGNISKLLVLAPADGFNLYRTIENVEKLKNTRFFYNDGKKQITNINYTWDNKDLLNKSRFKIKNNISYPAYDGRKINLDNYIIYPEDSLRENSFKIKKVKYEYSFNENGTIACENKSAYRTDGNLEGLKEKIDRISNNLLSKQFEVFYNYDSKNNLVSQDVKLIEGPDTNNDYEYPFLNGELSSGAKIIYKYDEFDRLTELKVSYPNVENYLSEKYTYHPSQNYILKVNRYNSNGFPNSIANLIEYTYNSLGDVIEVFYYGEERYREYWKKKQYYDYEYDSHDNWVKCTMFLDGTKSKEPNVIAVRKIEYYNDK